MILALLVGSAFCQWSWPYPRLNPGQAVQPNPDLVARYSFAKSATTPIRDVVSGCYDSNQWALTFDDGPGDGTDMVLAELAKQRIKATFFIIGISALNYPEELKRVVAAGHNLAIHT